MKAYGFKRKKYTVLPLFLVLSLFAAFFIFSCQGFDDGMGSIVINFGGGTRYTARTPDGLDPRIANALSYTVTLTGTGTITRTLSPGISSVRMAVPPGTWEVSITANYYGEKFATGEAEDVVEIKAGQSTQVPISMQLTETIFYVVSNDEEWNSVINDLPDLGNRECTIIITITNSFPTSTPFDMNTNYSANITIRGNHTIWQNGSIASGQLSLLNINNNVTVTLKDTKLIGIDNNENALVRISGGHFIMEGSTSISGNTHIGDGVGDFDGFGGGVHIGSGEFIMRGGTIGGNQAFQGGGVYVSSNGNFIKTGGTIYGLGAGANSNTINGEPGSMGNTVYVEAGNSIFITGPGFRNSTAGPADNMNSNTGEGF